MAVHVDPGIVTYLFLRLSLPGVGCICSHMWRCGLVYQPLFSTNSFGISSRPFGIFMGITTMSGIKQISIKNS